MRSSFLSRRSVSALKYKIAALTILLVATPVASGFSAEVKQPIRSTRPVNALNLQPDETLEFDVVIAGGSTAAFAAALASAESGARTALIEPTDWVGGQLTSSGVPAVDEAWHTVGNLKSGEATLNVAQIARNPANITPNFLAALQAIESPGECWVSRFCFCPDRFLERQLLPLQRHAGERLTVYLNTVVKHVELSDRGSLIRSLTAIARTAKPGVTSNGYDRLPSVDLPDWYSPQPSKRFDKRILRFAGTSRVGRNTVFIDATEWGEILALSGVPYLQGIEDSDGSQHGNDTCGQATVFCLVEEFLAEPRDEAKRDVHVENLGFGAYRDQSDAWQRIWTYRRIRGRGDPSPGDLSLQNWGYSLELQEGGNDYPFGYLFKSREATARERANWQGGVDLKVMTAAEQRALAWHAWFKQHAPPEIDSRRIVLNSQVLGTSHGLAKLPYIRDTRRSIGLDSFVLRFADLSGPAAQRTGTRFEDRIALGAYPADIHALAKCPVPLYIHDTHDTLPFYIPFRALTNNQLGNLLVAGKTMAQSFLANSATRLHPIEWSSGTAAGVSAAWMARNGKSSRQAYSSIKDFQSSIKDRTPIDWQLK